MKWDQIETKWTLMTRRIRADIGPSPRDAAQEYAQSALKTVMRREGAVPSLAEARLSTIKDPELKSSVK